jgi:hypothetical protein
MNRLFALTALFVATAPLLACSGEPNGPSEPATSSTSEAILGHSGGCTLGLAAGVTLYSEKDCNGQVACGLNYGGPVPFGVASYRQGTEDGVLLPGGTSGWSEPFARAPLAQRQCVNTTSIAPSSWRWVEFTD